MQYLDLLESVAAAAVITEYSLVNDKVARVVMSAAKDTITEEEIFRAVTSSTGGQATPIKNTFRTLTANSITGYVALVPETKQITAGNLAAKFQRVESNLYMDASDKTLWELSEGAGGKALTRRGRDDLASLLDDARVGVKASVPRITSIAACNAEPRQVVAFVNSRGDLTPDLDVGFCVKRDGDKHYVMSAHYNDPIEISSKEIVAIYTPETQPRAEGMKLTAGAVDTSVMVEYYRKAYGYDAEYLRKLMEIIKRDYA